MKKNIRLTVAAKKAAREMNTPYGEVIEFLHNIFGNCRVSFRKDVGFWKKEVACPTYVYTRNGRRNLITRRRILRVTQKYIDVVISQRPDWRNWSVFMPPLIDSEIPSTYEGVEVGYYVKSWRWDNRKQRMIFDFF